ncbi:MAG: glucose-6-phosphate isomerase [Clostridiales bacterium]|nr:glucose-6-phosphate isomerase [Clostridiales bacterium]
MRDSEKKAALDWSRGCCIDFDFQTGRSALAPAGKRRLSEMRGLFLDGEALEAQIAKEDRIIYEYHALDIPQTPGDLSFGFSILQPGKIGDEYYFTKGHFHSILNTAEIYSCTRGHGYLLLENKEGDSRAIEMLPGRIGYVPKGYAHRSVNVSPDEPFVTLFAYRADAGHDYATIETTGFRKLMVERDGAPVLMDNPKWLGK